MSTLWVPVAIGIGTGLFFAFASGMVSQTFPKISSVLYGVSYASIIAGSVVGYVLTVGI